MPRESTPTEPAPARESLSRKLELHELGVERG